MTALRRRRFTPKIDPNATLSYYFGLAAGSPIAQASKRGPPLTFTRGSSGSYFNESKVLVTAANNLPRFDHNPISGAPLGLLIEESRENLCLQSEVFGTTWAVTTASITTNSVAAPDGTTTADTLVEDGTAATSHFVEQVLVNADFTDSLDYSFSVFVQATANRDDVRVALTTKSNLVKFAYFDLTAKTVGSVSAGYRGAIEDVGGGWLRCTLMGDILTGATNPVIRIDVAEADNDIVFNGLSQDSLYLWGAQVEEGSSPTSYIKNIATQITRSADVCSVTDVGWFNASAGSLLVEGSFPFAGDAERSLATIDDGSALDRIRFYLDAADNVNFETINSADTNGASDGAAVIAVNTAFKGAGVYSDDDVIAAVDGTLSGADVLAGIPLSDTITTLRIGDDSVGTPFNGHVLTARYWDIRKSNAFLEGITT